jgi:hypothetical protein
VPWHLVLLRTSDVYAVLADFEAFPTGVQFAAVLRWRPRPGSLDPRTRRHPMIGFGSDGEGPRLGIGFANGRKASFGRHLFQFPDAEPERPVLMPRGGGGGGDEWRMGLWLWPLPPAGPLTFVVDWSEMGVAETSVTADAGDLVAAATKAEQLWTIDPAGASHTGGAFGGGWAGAVVTSTPQPRQGQE